MCLVGNVFMSYQLLFLMPQVESRMHLNSSEG